MDAMRLTLPRFEHELPAMVTDPVHTADPGHVPDAAQQANSAAQNAVGNDPAGDGTDLAGRGEPGDLAPIPHDAGQPDPHAPG